MMKVYFLPQIVMLVLFVELSFGQEQFAESDSSVFHADVGASLNGTTGNAVPFWMRSNQYGSIPLEGASVSVFGTLGKTFDPRRSDRLVDWAGNMDIRINAGSRVEVIPVEAYVKGRLSIFQVKVGRSRDREGLMDRQLSSGSFTLSGNALGIPKVELSIPEYWHLPWTGKLLALKGNASYGWMGKVPIQYGDNSGVEVATKYHHLSFYGRFGKPDWNLKLYGAVNHDVIWGSDKFIFGDQYDLSIWNELWHVLSGKNYVGAAEYRGTLDISKVGNHLGSLDVGAEYNFGSNNIYVYRQFFYDKGALGHYANLKDGLTGVVWNNNNKQENKWHLKKILLECFYSKDQAGEPGAKFTPSGPEYYYNHAVYKEGFSYKGQSLGTPLITRYADARENQAHAPGNYFISNRVVALHVGILLDYHDYGILLKGTAARHYGDYRTSGPDEQWFNGDRIKQSFNYGRFTSVSQFSGIIEAKRVLSKRCWVSASLAADHGKLLKNSIGGLLNVSYVLR